VAAFVFGQVALYRLSRGVKMLDRLRISEETMKKKTIIAILLAGVAYAKKRTTSRRHKYKFGWYN
jgi:hypothetical protein